MSHEFFPLSCIPGHGSTMFRDNILYSPGQYEYGKPVNRLQSAVVMDHNYLHLKKRRIL